MPKIISQDGELVTVQLDDGSTKRMTRASYEMLYGGGPEQDNYTADPDDAGPAPEPTDEPIPDVVPGSGVMNFSAPKNDPIYQDDRGVKISPARSGTPVNQVPPKPALDHVVDGVMGAEQEDDSPISPSDPSIVAKDNKGVLLQLPNKKRVWLSTAEYERLYGPKPDRTPVAQPQKKDNVPARPEGDVEAARREMAAQNPPPAAAPAPAPKPPAARPENLVAKAPATPPPPNEDLPNENIGVTKGKVPLVKDVPAPAGSDELLPIDGEDTAAAETKQSRFGFPLPDKYMKTTPNGWHGANRTKKGDGFLNRKKYPHKGEDYAVPIGTPVTAAADGEVERVVDHEDGDAGGLRVRIKHDDGTTGTFSMHLSDTLGLKVGDKVKKGQTIGLSGDSGNAKGEPHLHQEYFQGGQDVSLQTFYGDAAPPTGLDNMRAGIAADKASAQANDPATILRAARGGIANAAEEQLEGIDEETASRAAQADAEFAERQTYADNLAANEVERRQQADKDRAGQKKYFDKYEKSVEDFSKMEIDPDRYAGGRSTFQKIMAGLSMLLGAGAQVMAKDANGNPIFKSNPGIDIINDAIDKDIKLQMASIDKAGDVVGKRRQLFIDYGELADSNASEYKLRSAAEDKRVANAIEMIAAKHANPQIKAQGKQLAAQKRMDAETKIADVAVNEWQLQNSEDATAARTQVALMRAQTAAAKEEAKRREKLPPEGATTRVYVPETKSWQVAKIDTDRHADLSRYGLPGYVDFGKKGAKDAGERMSTANEIHKNLSILEAKASSLSAEDLHKFLRSKDGAEALAAYSRNFNAYRKLTGSGAALNPIEVELLKAAGGGDPSSLATLLNKEAYRAGLGEAKKALLSETASFLGHKGINVAEYPGFHLAEYQVPKQDSKVELQKKAFRAFARGGVNPDTGKYVPAKPRSLAAINHSIGEYLWNSPGSAVVGKDGKTKSVAGFTDSNPAEQREFADGMVNPMLQELYDMKKELTKTAQAAKAERDPAKKKAAMDAHALMATAYTEFSKTIDLVVKGGELRVANKDGSAGRSIHIPTKKEVADYLTVKHTKEQTNDYLK